MAQATSLAAAQLTCAPSQAAVSCRASKQESQCLVASWKKAKFATPVSVSTTCPQRVAARVVTRAVAEEASTAKAAEGSAKYHFIVANAQFMLDEEEHFQEQLKERLRWLGERGEEQNFWLVYEPKFLEEFPEISKRLKRPAVALVSTDALWIT
eukprot:TRINITY_DN21847_c0_g1_i1.p2 TRINITY_DN21847_c0_g1~~TRINITY_DN21847_c0_g1_i1.p2  ORF type:complete len:154 (+),score=19.99 TRINITY_DN21847_c0_g1_i1:120-581(+)